MPFIAALAGTTFAAAGAAKLSRVPAYERLVAGLDWSEDERRRVGAAELLGGALMLFGPTRRLGAGLVLAASGAAITAELRAGETQLAVPRAGLMLAALIVAAA